MDNRTPFAFISYSRRDVAVATDLRQRLEKYVYSKELVEPKYRPKDEKYIRPVFQDLTDLHTRGDNFWDDLKEKVRDSRYFVVICSANSAVSKAVKDGVSYFLQTHNGDSSLIIPVFIDGIVPMNAVIDEIVKVRNCPVYITSKDKEGQTGRKYCFYHLLEYLLHVDFYKLYNRYEEHKKRKRTKRIVVIASFVGVILFATIYGWVSSTRLAEEQKQRAITAEALTKFERKTFPYSLVVGYVNNFMRPALKSLKNIREAKPHIIIYMPYAYDDLDVRMYAEKMNRIVTSTASFIGFSTEDIAVKERERSVSLMKADFRNSDVPIYLDYARTIVAFKYVVDYKFNSEENPLLVEDTKANRDKMVQEYTDEFIVHALQNLDEYRPSIHFVRSEAELRQVLDTIINNK